MKSRLVRAVTRCALGTVIAVTLVGCSQDARQSAAGADVTGFYAAVAAGDWPSACALLAPATLAAVEQDAPCSEALSDEDLPAGGAIEGTQVWGRAAQIELDDDTVFLAEFPDGWRITAAGCTPQSEGPYDCAIEG